MKRLYLTVEGQTEQTFAVDVLQPHLAQFSVHVVKPRLTGLHSRRGGRVPTGGLLGTFRHSLADIRRWMREDHSKDARFSIMVDLYSLPGDFPGYAAAMELADPHAQAAQLEEALAAELGDHRFIPYLQVHEFESIVLADFDGFLTWFDQIDKQVERLRSECAVFETPEHINHGQNTHPKARIKSHIPDYDENVDGPILAEYAGVPNIKQRCPHFCQWVETLERLDSATD